ncbi:MAG: T9SS type A sorting domain-containing protein [Bacteroidaceae bacterium]|nr:T9SS type A sorting domain-containing protein [Bacteroidaceae bacterium]
MFGDFSMVVSDENVLEMGDMGFEDGAIQLTFKALQEGEAVVKAFIAGKQAECTVTVIYSTAVNKVVAENPLSYGNGTVKAQGCAIVVYNTLGAKVMAGYDSCDTASLPAGIYIAKATRADGTTASIKFIVK